MEKKRVAIYSRKENTIEEIRAYVRNHSDWEAVGCYIDNGSSGCDKNRKNLTQMIDDYDDGKFDIVIVTEMSQLCRSSETLMYIRRRNKEFLESVYCINTEKFFKLI